MPAYVRYFLLITLLCQMPSAPATTIHRCEAINGRITFTTLSCAASESSSRYSKSVHSRLASDLTALMPEAQRLADSIRHEKQKERTNHRRKEPRTECGNLISARERREAIINQRVSSPA
jgi:hypothetical protein